MKGVKMGFLIIVTVLMVVVFIAIIVISSLFSGGKENKNKNINNIKQIEQS